jgi:C_GCAxxG_C_C family probable redox protein
MASDRDPDAVQLARSLFLRDDNYYGCAESTLVALQQTFGLPDADDSSAAMALNGGIAYSGGVCGAVSGAALALGRLAQSRIPDHGQAKRTARRFTQELMTEFEARFGASNCADLIDYDISIQEEHDAFIESGVWRRNCMQQIEFSVAMLYALADPTTWQHAVAAAEDSVDTIGAEHE